MIPSRTAFIGLLVAVASVVAGCGADDQRLIGCAASCPDGLTCDVHTGSCVPAFGSAPEDALQCRTSADCRLPTPLCDTSRFRCVECLADAQCDSGVCAQGACLPVPEQCAVAQQVEVGEKPVVLRGSTLNRVNDATTTCALGQGAPDLVYAVVVKENVRLTAVATPAPGSTYLPVLELREHCAATDPDNVLACAWAWGAGLGASISRDLGPGTYFLWVDADSGTSGEFTLELFTQPAVPGASCGLPTKLEGDEAVEVIEGDTTGRIHQSWGTCGGSGPEEVYAVELTEPRRLRVTVTSTRSSYQPLVYLRRPGRCEERSGAAQLDCGVAPAGGTVVLDIPRLEPGTYPLFVDGAIAGSFEAGAGPYTLKVERLPPLALAANDACGAAQELVVPAQGTLQVSGDTSAALSDATSVCGGGAADVVYRFTLAEAAQVIARVVPTEGSPLIPVVYLRHACDSEYGVDLFACTTAQKPAEASQIALGTLPAGTWWLWVDGAQQTRGPFSLFLQTLAPQAPPANDGCAAPDLVAPAMQPVNVVGTTYGATDDQYGCTLPEGAPSADVVYALDVPAPSSLALELRATPGSSLLPVMYLDRHGVCGVPGVNDRLFCVGADPNEPGRVGQALGEVAAGTYYVWVDGDVTSSGGFELAASLGPPVPPPANDGCGTVQVVTLTNPVTGDTRSADDSTSGYCQSYYRGSGEGGADVAYAFSVPTLQPVTITVTPDPVEGALFQPAVYLRGAGELCGSVEQADQLGCAVSPAMGSPATLQLPALPAGAYTVWVDGVSRTRGRFTLSVQ